MSSNSDEPRYGDADAIRSERRAGRDEEYTVFGDGTDTWPLGLMYKVPFNGGWRFCPYSGLGKEIRKPTREKLEASIQTRWNNRKG